MRFEQAACYVMKVIVWHKLFILLQINFFLNIDALKANQKGIYIGQTDWRTDRWTERRKTFVYFSKLIVLKKNWKYEKKQEFKQKSNKHYFLLQCILFGKFTEKHFLRFFYKKSWKGGNGRFSFHYWMSGNTLLWIYSYKKHCQTRLLLKERNLFYFYGFEVRNWFDIVSLILEAILNIDTSFKFNKNAWKLHSLDSNAEKNSIN